MTTDIHIRFHKLPGEPEYKYFVHDRATNTYLKGNYWVSDIADAQAFRTQLAAENGLNRWRMSLQPEPEAAATDKDQIDMFAEG